MADVPTLPWEAIGPEMSSLIKSTVNKLDREWPGRLSHAPHARTILQQSVSVVFDTYNTILFICADDREHVPRKLEFSLATTPLARTILDCLFNVIYLLDDPPSRADDYYKAGWREFAEEYMRFSRAYESDPAWTEWLAQHRTFIEKGIATGIVTELEAKATLSGDAPNRPKRWPTPSRMRDDRALSDERKTFLEYLEDWFYREMSQDSHLSLPGLIRRSSSLPRTVDRRSVLEKQRSDGVFTTVTLVLALISEIVAEFDFELRDRTLYLWHVVVPFWGDAKELYTRRYAALLGAQG